MKRKTINLEKLNELSTTDLREVVVKLLTFATNNSQHDLETDIEVGLEHWERNERKRRDGFKQALNIVKGVYLCPT